MSRLMSVAFTEQAVVERRKTVTRRKGWQFLKPGDTITLCRKVMGRKKGEPLVRLAEVEVVDVRREKLGKVCPIHGADPEYVAAEMTAEGFPGMKGNRFVDHYFLNAQKITCHDDVTRIEWRYLDAPSSSPETSEGTA